MRQQRSWGGVGVGWVGGGAGGRRGCHLIALLATNALLLALLFVESAAQNFSCWKLLQRVEPSLFGIVASVLFFTHKQPPPPLPESLFSIPQELLAEVSSQFKPLPAGRRSRSEGEAVCREEEHRQRAAQGDSGP